MELIVYVVEIKFHKLDTQRKRRKRATVDIDIDEALRTSGSQAVG